MVLLLPTSAFPPLLSRGSFSHLNTLLLSFTYLSYTLASSPPLYNYLPTFGGTIPTPSCPSIGPTFPLSSSLATPVIPSSLYCLGFPAVSDQGDPLLSVYLFIMAGGGGGREGGERLEDSELHVHLALAFERRVREDLGREVIPTPGNADTDGI